MRHDVAQTTSRQANITNQRRQAADRTRGLKAVAALVHGTAAKQDHGRSRGGVSLREGDNLACIKACLLCSPCGSEGQDVRRQFLKSGSVSFNKRRVIKPFGDDDVHDGQGEGSVGPRPDQLAEIAIESTHTVEIEKFVPKASIITIATRPTYLAPEDMVGQEAFAVIRDAMKKKKMVGVGRVVMASRERMMMLEYFGKGHHGHHVALSLCGKGNNGQSHNYHAADQRILLW